MNERLRDGISTHVGDSPESESAGRVIQDHCGFLNRSRKRSSYSR